MPRSLCLQFFSQEKTCIEVSKTVERKRSPWRWKTAYWQQEPACMFWLSSIRSLEFLNTLARDKTGFFTNVSSQKLLGILLETFFIEQSGDRVVSNSLLKNYRVILWHWQLLTPLRGLPIPVPRPPHQIVRPECHYRPWLVVDPWRRQCTPLLCRLCVAVLLCVHSMALWYVHCMALLPL